MGRLVSRLSRGSLQAEALELCLTIQGPALDLCPTIQVPRRELRPETGVHQKLSLGCELPR